MAEWIAPEINPGGRIHGGARAFVAVTCAGLIALGTIAVALADDVHAVAPRETRAGASAW